MTRLALFGLAAVTALSPLALAQQQTDSAPATQPSAEQRVVIDRDQIAQVTLATARDGPAVGQRADQLEPVALFYGPLPTVFTFADDDQLVVAFPRWTLPTNFTVAMVTDGELVPFPDAETNQFLPTQPDKYDPRTHLVSVQSVVRDSDKRIWLLDTGSINLQPPIEGGPKMWAYTADGRRVKEITFGDAIKPKTYLNDVRFDLSRGEEGFAYITDSGEGGIIVVDLASGKAWRTLDGHPSVKADDIVMNLEGEPLLRRPPQGEPQPVKIHSDGISLSPDGKTLYYTALTSRDIFAVPTDALADPNLPADQVAQQVRKVAQKPSANDGIVADAQGRIYTTDFEDNAIRVVTPFASESGDSEPQVAAGRETVRILFQDERLLWPDAVWIHDGHLYVTSNQLNRQPQFHNGQSRLNPPFVLFRYPVEARAIEQR